MGAAIGADKFSTWCRQEQTYLEQLLAQPLGLEARGHLGMSGFVVLDAVQAEERADAEAAQMLGRDGGMYGWRS